MAFGALHSARRAWRKLFLVARATSPTLNLTPASRERIPTSYRAAGYDQNLRVSSHLHHLTGPNPYA